ncbi:MAPEG family protein [Nordella sp. HKS 07]|uniref:MAPEG family protein n=1 Tax=Nordella sp. HKS 07 TaxID=2712222 RepID=UPI0013E1D54D|nr:MAPEG family protein [Nordella sp. HKS 07]QIG50443.1 MAPEG family protein [Nordella sp. HKS 07]
MSLQQALLLPVFLHMLMTMGLGVASALARRTALLTGRVRMKDIVLDSSTWPDDVRKLGNNYDNQFQLPMFWYAGVAFTLALGLVDGVAVAFAWAFFALRIAHSFIHVGRNILVRRFYVFVAGAVVLTLSWLWLAYKVFG